MKVISSSTTFINKWLMPVSWFAGLSIVMLAGITNGAVEQDIMFLVTPLLMMAAGYLMFRNMLWDIVDEVVDFGDRLVVTWKGKKESILISNIMNVSYKVDQNPPRVTLRLRSPCRFGSEITFSPIVRGAYLLNGNRNAIVEDLIVRVDEARTRAARDAAAQEGQAR